MNVRPNVEFFKSCFHNYGVVSLLVCMNKKYTTGCMVSESPLPLLQFFRYATCITFFFPYWLLKVVLKKGYPPSSSNQCRVKKYFGIQFDMNLPKTLAKWKSFLDHCTLTWKPAFLTRLTAIEFCFVLVWFVLVYLVGFWCRGSNVNFLKIGLFMKWMIVCEKR